MKVNLRAWSRAAATVALFGVGACNCDNTNEVSTLSGSDFPGSSVDEAFLSSDGVAFSESGLDVDADSVQVFRNVSNNDAIVTFVADNGDGISTLYASYYNGSSFAAPVAIRGAAEDRDGYAPWDVQVLFLETSSFSGADGSATSNGRGRDGDAILTYVGRQIDDPSSADIDAKYRAYAAYFDRSKATADAKDGVVRGFTTTSTPVDFDHVIPDDVALADADPSVEYVGFASDSLRGTHQFGDVGGPGVLSGDPTSFVQILVRKAPTTSAATPIAARWFAIPFDLGQTGNAFVAQSGATSGQLAPGLGTLDATDGVSDVVVVHNEFVLWTASTVGGSNEDTVLTATSLSASGILGAINVGSDPTSTVDSTSLPSLANVYGTDHEVGGLYVITAEAGFADTGVTGKRASDRDLVIAQIDVGGTTRSIVEADALTGTVDTADQDSDFLQVRSGAGGAIASGVTSVVHRDGGLITVQFRQGLTDTTDSNDAGDGNNLTVTDAGLPIGAPSSNQVDRLQVIQTNRPASALSTSLLATPVKVPALEATGAAGATPLPQGPTGSFAFQIGLMNGAAATDGGVNEVADIEQTNPDVVFFRYTQLNDQGATAPVPSEVRLFTSGISVTHGASDADRPTVSQLRGSAGVPSGAVVQLPNTSGNKGEHANWNPGDFAAVVVDNFAAAGDAVTFFVCNSNHVADDPSDPLVTGEYAARRAYVWNGVATELISSDADLNLQTVQPGFRVAVLRDRIHAFWGEYETTPNNNFRLATRSWAKGSALPATPALTAAPSFIDLATPGEINDVEILEGSDRLGVYIYEEYHMYYNETRSDAAHYRMADGLSDPTLVDNDPYDTLQSDRLFRNDGPNELSRSFFFYSKYRDANEEDIRLFVRVHD